MRCSYSTCAQDTEGNVIEGAIVYMVPYESPSNSDITQAVNLYSTEDSVSGQSSWQTDSQGNAFFWLEEGEYSVITAKNGASHVLPHVRISCGDAALGQLQVEEKEFAIGDGVETSFTVAVNRQILKVTIVDGEGNVRSPQCVESGGNLLINYAPDCVPDSHTVKVLCTSQ